MLYNREKSRLLHVPKLERDLGGSGVLDLLLAFSVLFTLS